MILYRIANEVLNVSKEDFSGLLLRTLKDMDLASIMKNGFRVCGLYPLDRKEVDYSKVFIRKEETKEQAVVPVVSEPTINPLIILESFERYINPSTLQIFKFCIESDEWNGSTEDKNLFSVWKNLATDCVNGQYHASLMIQVSNNYYIVSEKIVLIT